MEGMNLINHKVKEAKSFVRNYNISRKGTMPTSVKVIDELVEKSIAHIVAEIIEYVPHSVVSRTIVKRTTGNVTILAYDQGEESAERVSPFDSYIQIIDGTAAFVINGDSYELHKGEGIIIPAHARYCFIANEQFKMISTVIKSGYED